MRTVLPLFFCLLIVSACAPRAVDRPVGNVPAETLGRTKVFALFYDKTVESVTLGKGRVSLSYYSPTGEIRQLREGQQRLGTWRVNKNGRICLAMDGAKEKCRVMVREADGSYRKYVVKKNGKHRAVVGYRRFIPGNPNNL